MAERLRRILLVSHEATRSGAPMIVLHFARWLRANTDIDARILLLDGGPLEEDFTEVFPTAVWSATGVSQLPRWFRDELDSFDVAHLNSIGSLDAVRLLPPSLPTVLHVHELSFNLMHGLTTPRREALPTVRRYVAAAQAVRSALLQEYGLAPELVDVCYEFVPVREVPPPADPRDLRTLIGAAPDALVVGSMGTVEWRKGADLFVQLALALNRVRGAADVHFAWIGGPMRFEPTTPDVVQRDVAAAGLAGQVHFTGPIPNGAAAVSAFDIFTLMSREDPFPLVCIEAAAQQVPILCFEGGGGMVEFVADGSGVAVPFLDVEQMAIEINTLLTDADHRRRLGAAARQRAYDMCDVSVGSPILLESLAKAAR